MLKNNGPNIEPWGAPASMLFVSAVMKSKLPPTTYSTVLPTQTKDWPVWTKSKVLNVAF